MNLSIVGSKHIKLMILGKSLTLSNLNLHSRKKETLATSLPASLDCDEAPIKETQ